MCFISFLSHAHSGSSVGGLSEGEAWSLETELAHSEVMMSLIDGA